MGRPGKLSTLREPGTRIAIFTTASLPWRTGTAVNPLLRAAYLAHLYPDVKVTLVIPWLAVSEQDQLYPDGITFQTPEDQQHWVRAWVEQRTNFAAAFDIRLYPGRYDDAFRSIFPVGDLTDLYSNEEADIAVLEEPEHLTWFHHGRRWRACFRHVVGIVHTNYREYVAHGSGGHGGPAIARVVALATRQVCSIHCHKVIKLSDAVQNLPRQTIAFVHGVSPAFLAIGDGVAAAVHAPEGGCMEGSQQSDSWNAASCLQAETPTSAAQSDANARAAAMPAHTEPAGLRDDSGPDVANADEVCSGSAPAAAARRSNEEQPVICRLTPSSGSQLRVELNCGRAIGASTDSHGSNATSMARIGAAIPGSSHAQAFTSRAYFLGKALWGKGYSELLAQLVQCQRRGLAPIAMDIYGSGEDIEDIKSRAALLGLLLTFHGPIDHLSKEIESYRVFVNPSLSDVVATTSAEALAMGKWLVCPRHPSNEFFSTFANCLVYRSCEEFHAHVAYAQAHNPAPLSAGERRRLTWEDATERFLDAAAIKPWEWPRLWSRVPDFFTWQLMNAGNGLEAVRRAVGAGRNTAHSPATLAEYDPRAAAAAEAAERALRADHVAYHLAQGYPPPRLLP